MATQRRNGLKFRFYCGFLSSDSLLFWLAGWQWLWSFRVPFRSIRRQFRDKINAPFRFRDSFSIRRGQLFAAAAALMTSTNIPQWKGTHWREVGLIGRKRPQKWRNFHWLPGFTLSSRPSTPQSRFLFGIKALPFFSPLFLDWQRAQKGEQRGGDAPKTKEE